MSRRGQKRAIIEVWRLGFHVSRKNNPKQKIAHSNLIICYSIKLSQKRFIIQTIVLISHWTVEDWAPVTSNLIQSNPLTPLSLESDWISSLYTVTPLRGTSFNSRHLEVRAVFLDPKWQEWLPAKVKASLETISLKRVINLACLHYLWPTDPPCCWPCPGRSRQSRCSVLYLPSSRWGSPGSHPPRWTPWEGKMIHSSHTVEKEL